MQEFHWSVSVVRFRVWVRFVEWFHSTIHSFQTSFIVCGRHCFCTLGINYYYSYIYTGIYCYYKSVACYLLHRPLICLCMECLWIICFLYWRENFPDKTFEPAAALTSADILLWSVRPMEVKCCCLLVISASLVILSLAFLYLLSIFSLIQLLITCLFQMIVMRDVEKLCGWIRIMIIYVMSGIAGSLSSAIFLPYHVEVWTTLGIDNNNYN